ncbi:MAG: hypothetical protein R3C18_10305 [Planctomycetaceae bacterium]
MVILVGALVGLGTANYRHLRIAWLKHSFRRTVQTELERGGNLDFLASSDQFKELISVGGTEAGADVLIVMIRSGNQQEAAVAAMFLPEVGEDGARVAPILQAIFDSPQQVVQTQP